MLPGPKCIKFEPTAQLQLCSAQTSGHTPLPVPNHKLPKHSIQLEYYAYLLHLVSQQIFVEYYALETAFTVEYYALD